MAQDDAQHVSSPSLSILVDDRGTGAKVDLDFKAGLDFDAAKRFGALGLESFYEPPDAVIATVESMLLNNVTVSIASSSAAADRSSHARLRRVISEPPVST